MMALAGNWCGGTITYQTSGCTISNCTVTGSQAGITLYNSAATISSATTNMNAWNMQVQQAYFNTGVTIWGAWTNEVVKRKETKKQKADREARERHDQAMALAREVERQEKAEEAKKRARKLLVEHLNPAQRLTLEQAGYFDVQVGKKTYRIRNGTHGNVRLLEKGVEKISYCIQPPGVPEGDAMLAQKLHLETNEAGFLAVANARPLAAAVY